MGKPVEIEFLMRDKLSGGVMASGKTVVTLGNQVDETTRKIKQMGHSAELETGKMDRAFKQVLGGAAFAAFLRQVVKVRGEIQQLGMAFETMLGSKKEADKMMSEIVDFAARTPFTVTDVADNVKQLIAMGVASEDAMATLKALGDVAAGVAVPISRIAINYGQVATLGKLQTRELRDFAMAGVPLLEELSKLLGVTKAEVQELISKGRIGFPMVEQAFKNMSGEGGKFYNLMERTNKSVTGQISNVMDKLEVKLNEIGQANEGLIYGAIKGVSSLIENYDKIGRILVPLIATVGAYKAALIGVRAVQKAGLWLDQIRLIALCRKELGLLTAAQQAFNLKALQNPYILLASAIIGAAAAIWQFVSAERAKQKAIDETLQPLRDEFTQTNLLVEKLKNANLQEEERKKILQQLKEVNPGIVKGLEDEKDAVEALTTRLEAYNKAKLAEIAVKKFSLTGGFEEAVEDLEKAQGKMQERSADIIDIYSTLFTRFRELETKNADIPENLRTLFTSVIDSAAPETEKVETLFTAYRAILDKVKAAHGAYTGPDRSTADLLFGGLDISKYTKALGKLSAQTEEYEEKADNLKAKITAIANAVYDNEEQRQEFILSQWAIYFPNEVQKVDAAVDAAQEKTRTWKDEIEDIVKGDYKADIEAASNIPEVIDAIQKAIKAEKERVENMKPLLVKAGFDFTGMKFPAGYTPSPLEQKWSTDFIKAQNNLTELTSAQTTLGFPDKQKGADPVVKKLQTQIDLTKSAKEEYAKLLKFMSSEAAYKLLKSTSGYANIRLEDIVSTKGENEGYIKYLESQIKAISTRKTKEAKALVIKLQKELDGLRLENLYNAASRAGALAKLDKEYAKTLSGQVRQSQFDVRQAEIDAMDEGFAREQKQIALNYDRLLYENETRQKEWIEAARNNAKEKWLLENPDKDETQFTQTFTVADLSPEQQAALKKYTESANAFRARSEEKLLEELVKKYADYTTQRQLLEKQYDDDIAALMSTRTSANADMVDRAIAEVRRQKDSALADLDVTMQSSTSLWGQLFDDLAHRTNAELRAIIDNAREVLEYVSNTPSANIESKFGLTREQLLNLKGNAAELGAAYDALYKKTEQFNRRNPFAALSSAKSLRSVNGDLKKAEADLAKAQAAGDKDGIKSGNEKIKILNRQKDLYKGDLKNAAKEAVGYLTDVGGSFEQIGAASGDAGLESFGKTLGDLGGIAQSFMQGGPIAAGITAVTTGLTAIFSSAAKYRAALKQMREDLAAFQAQYKLAMADMELEGENSINIFSEDAFEKAVTALRQMERFYDEFIEKINKKDTLQFGSGWFDQIRAARAQMKGITTDLQNIWVQTRHSTWFRSAKGFYLKDKYPELFEGEYGFNVEAARVLLDTNNQLNDEAKRQIQEVIDLYDQMKEAEEAFKDYLTDTFGDVGSSLGDSIVTAFEDGTDAMENWADSFENVLKNLAKQLMTTLFLQKHFDKLEEDLTNIYDNFGDDPNRVGSEVTALLGRFFSNMGSVVEEASDWYKNFVDQAGKYGFDLTGEDEGTTQSGQAGAFQTMSQDTGTKLEGLFTANGMRLANIEVMLADVQFGIYIIGDKLAAIEGNTKGCDEKLKRVVIFMERIERDGVKIQ